MKYKDFLIFDSLSNLIGFFVCFFTVIIFIYSLGFIKERKKEYYLWFFLTFVASLGIAFSNHLILLIILWEFLGLTLFKLINLYVDKETNWVAKKTFIIVGGSDGLLLLGFLIYMHINNYFVFGKPLYINNSLSFLSFLFIALGCFAKAGAIPLHTWIPPTSQYAPLPVVAYLPASVDKLLGIYLLVRAVKDMFILDNLSKAILLIVGSFTVICAVMMALVQHNVKKLLGFHAISQVGYMVLGIGCATPLGLAGGLFHMVNNAIYKSCLFLGAGNVEKNVHTSEIDNLGGLGKFMPLTFLTTLIASLSISGIPPLNGFVSKWIIYQSLINFISSSNSTILKFITSFSLASALIGSGLTLASFLKLNSGVFLGRRKEKVKEVKGLLLFSPLVLSSLCIVFGIFSYSTILPFIKKGAGEFSLGGLWKSSLATNLIILGVIFGLIVFKIMSAKKIRVSPAFVGGEELNIEEEVKISPFYNTIREMKFIKKIYNLAEKKNFGVYELLSKFVFLFVKLFRYLHNGVLPTYLVWCLVAMLGLFFVFFK